MIKKITLAKKLASYSALASAVLIFEKPASGETLRIKTDTSGLLLTPGQSFYLDINHDGIDDFVFSAEAFTSFNYHAKIAYILPENGASLADSDRNFPSVINSGEKIGGELQWKY